MKKTLLIICLLMSSAASAELVVIFDPTTQAVTKIAAAVRLDPSEYQGNPNCVVFTQESGMVAVHTLRRTVPDKYLKHQNGQIVEMNQSEKNQADLRILTALRNEAKSKFDATEPDGKVLKAIVLLLIDEINVLRRRDRDRSVDVSNASSLADLKSRWANRPALDDRTADQARTAIRGKLDDGSAD